MLSRVVFGLENHRMGQAVSVVIPALNEAQRLPVLLNRLASQTRPPDEVIVADGGSTDATAQIAESRGARVVAGGKPGVGRNAGAAAATGDLVIFFDADVEPPDTFVEHAVAEFVARDLTMACAPAKPLEPGAMNLFVCGFCNSYMRLLQGVSPRASGFCIIVRREAHVRIGGFDESLVLAEDHDYARRVSAIGRFGILRGVAIPGSMRRVEKEGMLRMVRLFLYTERYALVNAPIYRAPFEYEFSAFSDKAAPPARGFRRERTAAETPGATGRLLRMLAKPSSEIQTDAIAVMAVSALAASLGTTFLAVAGLSPAVYVPFAVAALSVTALSTLEALWKMRYEKRYGDFFMASVAVASDDVVADDGCFLARKGIDEVCEFHVVSGLNRMSALNREGLTGRLTILLETFQGVMVMLDELDTPFYRNITVVVGRSDLVGLMFRVGFDEISQPPRYDLPNRLAKRVLMARMGAVDGRDRLTARPEDYRMAALPAERFRSSEFRAVVERRIEKMQADLARLRARAEADAGASAEPSLAG